MKSLLEVFCVKCGALVLRPSSHIATSGVVYCNTSCRDRNRVAWNKGKIGCFSQDTLKRISQSQVGRIPWNKGKPASDDTRAKLKAARQQRIMRGEIHPMKGKHWSE